MKVNLPSTESERKKSLPIPLRSFDLGVFSGSSWTVSSRDLEFVVHFEQLTNFIERLVEGVCRQVDLDNGRLLLIGWRHVAQRLVIAVVVAVADVQATRISLRAEALPKNLSSAVLKNVRKSESS